MKSLCNLFVIGLIGVFALPLLHAAEVTLGKPGADPRRIEACETLLSRVLTVEEENPTLQQMIGYSGQVLIGGDYDHIKFTAASADAACGSIQQFHSTINAFCKAVDEKAVTQLGAQPTCEYDQPRGDCVEMMRYRQKLAVCTRGLTVEIACGG